MTILFSLQKPYISLPPEVLKLTGKKNVRLEFVSFANDKFFRSHQQSGLPVITAKITDTEVSNLSHPVIYEIPLEVSHSSEAAFPPVCVFWDEKGKACISHLRILITHGS